MKSFEDKNEDDFQKWDFKQVPLSESYPYEVPGVGGDCGSHYVKGFKRCSDCGAKTFYYEHCTDIHCPTCSFASLNRQAKKSTDKIRGFTEWVAQNNGCAMKNPRHIVFSPKSWSEGEPRSPEDLKKEWKSYFDVKKNCADMKRYSKALGEYYEYQDNLRRLNEGLLKDDRPYYTKWSWNSKRQESTKLKVYEEPKMPEKPLSEVLKDLEGVCVLHCFRIRGYDKVSSYVSEEMFKSDDNIKRRLREYRQKTKDERGFWQLLKEDVLGLGSWRAYVYYSPHIHFVGYGRIPLKSDTFLEKYGIVYKNLLGRSFNMEPKENDFGYTNEVQRTLVYLGSHATIKPRDESKKNQREWLFFGVGNFVRGRFVIDTEIVSSCMVNGKKIEKKVKVLSVNSVLSDVCFNKGCPAYDVTHNKSNPEFSLDKGNVIKASEIDRERVKYLGDGVIDVKSWKGRKIEHTIVELGRKYQTEGDNRKGSWFRYSLESLEEGDEGVICKVEDSLTFVKWYKWVPNMKSNSKPTVNDIDVTNKFESESIKKCGELDKGCIDDKIKTGSYPLIPSYIVDVLIPQCYAIGDYERAFSYVQMINNKEYLDKLREKNRDKGVV